MDNKPLISIIMPVYNSEQYLSEAIDSILNQTYAYFELIAIDDASIDDSWEIIKRYEKLDKRIRPFKNERNSGVTVTLNNGLRQARGEYVARMDSDDISLPKRFEEEVEVLNNGADLVGTNIYFINSSGDIIGSREYSNNVDKVIKIESPLAHPTVMFKKEFLGKTGFYRPEFNSAEDYDLWIRFYQNGAKIEVIQQKLLKYRQHKNAIKYVDTKKTIRTTIKVKEHAKRGGLKLGILGELRLLFEKIILIVPQKIIIRAFFMLKGNK